ncbi:hypothetical protein LXL04_010714 [Taraxacum kok-saghyz]
MTKPAHSSSPANKVFSIDDLLTGILLRLPVRSLLRFKSVSKHWYFLITSPSFKLIRNRSPDPPLGLFVPIRNNKPHLVYDFISFDIENPVKAPLPTPIFGPNVEAIDIQHSCNGLMLCRSHSSDFNKLARCALPNEYYVYNPTINQFITLPRTENYDRFGRSGMTIAFDPSKSSDYRIIYVCGFVNTNNLLGDMNYKIEIFSSTTRTWKSSSQFSFDRRVYLNFTNGVYWNNAIHWIQAGFILYFNLDDECIHEKPTPLRLLGLDEGLNHIFSSQDQLLLVEFELLSLHSKFKIHELKRDYSTWSVKYHVDLEQIGGSFPEIMNPHLAFHFEFVVLSLVLGEKEDDSFLVLKAHGKALRFNVVTKTFQKLHDFPASHFRNVFEEMACGFQFVESFYSP